METLGELIIVIIVIIIYPTLKKSINEIKNSCEKKKTGSVKNNSSHTVLVSYCHDDNSSAHLVFQELEDQLQEEEDKVSHLNKVKSKLEQQIDEVCVISTWMLIEKDLAFVEFWYGSLTLKIYLISRFTRRVGDWAYVNLFCRVLLWRRVLIWISEILNATVITGKKGFRRLNSMPDEKSLLKESNLYCIALYLHCIVIIDCRESCGEKGTDIKLVYVVL